MADGLKQLLLLLPAFIISLSSSAQWNDAITNPLGQKEFGCGAYANADFGTSCITNVFTANILEGNYIDNHLKGGVSSQLQKFNYAGAMLNYGLYGVWYNDTLKSKRICNFFFAIRHKAYYNCTFSPDVFNIAFYGNAMYAGKTAYLMPFSLNAISYQQAEIGVVCTNFGGSKAEMGIGVSFLAAHQLVAITERSALLYTDPTGQYLQFSSDGQAYFSDTSNSGPYTNGYGASLDLYFKAPYKIGKRNGTITASVTDLGFIYWNKYSQTFFKDTSLYYDGVTINSISDLQSVSFNSTSTDSLQKKYVPLNQKAFFHGIPATLSINSNTDYGKYHLELGYTYIYNANDIGYVYAQGDKYLPNGWMAALQLGYGGYSTVNAAFMIARQIRNTTWRVALNHLQGLIVPTYFGGAGVYLEYSHNFGK